jgi:hypothetical protein
MMRRLRRPSRGVAAGFVAIALGLVFTGVLSAQGIGVTVTPDRPPDNNDWYNHSFEVTFSHLVLTCEAPKTYSGPDGTDLSISGECTDPADPDVLPPETGTYTFKYDETDPTANPAHRGPDSNGWFNRPVPVDLNWSDVTSGPDGCPQGLTYSGGTDTSTCSDKAGNQASVTIGPLNYDATAPTASPNPPNGSGGWHAQPFNVTLNWTDTGSGVDSANCTETVNYTGGQRLVTCTDVAGNQGSITLEYLYDDGTPSISIDSGPANGSVSQDRTPSFSFSSDDPDAQFRCEIDANTFVPCTSPWPPQTALPLADGSHTFSVYAIDLAGNQSAVATRSWQIAELPTNTVAPTIVGFPEEGETLVADQGVWVGGTPPIFLTTHWQSCDAAANLCSDIGVTGDTYVVRAADIGRTLRVRVEASNQATQALGNPVLADSDPTAVVTALDRTLPRTTILGRPADPTNRQQATFTFESSRPGSTFECSVDGGAFEPCVSGRTYVGLAAGRHTFEVKATFVTTNTNEVLAELSPAAWVWRVDLERPPPPTSVVARRGDRRVRLSWVTPRVADVMGTRIGRVRAGRTAILFRVVPRSPFTDRGLVNGVLYRYTLQTRDQAGNLSKAIVVYARPRDPLLAPRDGAVVTRNPLLRWLGRPNATYYNVQVRRVLPGRDRKILTAWPIKTRYQIRARWFYRRWQTLTPGVYIWHVFPGLGRPQENRYGSLIGSSVFRKR